MEEPDGGRGNKPDYSNALKEPMYFGGSIEKNTPSVAGMSLSTLRAVFGSLGVEVEGSSKRLLHQLEVLSYVLHLSTGGRASLRSKGPFTVTTGPGGEGVSSGNCRAAPSLEGVLALKEPSIACPLLLALGGLRAR